MAKKKGRSKIAALPIRYHKKKGLQICLITSRKRGHWIVPTGKPEKKLSNSDVAQLEAYEEAGVLGRASRKQCFSHRTCSVSRKVERNLTLYPLKVRKELKHWPEDDHRSRKWIKVSRLAKYLSDLSLANKITHQLL